MFKFLVYYAIPLCVITSFYLGMARHLSLSTRNMPGELPDHHFEQIRARRRVRKKILISYNHTIIKREREHTSHHLTLLSTNRVFQKKECWISWCKGVILFVWFDTWVSIDGKTYALTEGLNKKFKILFLLLEHRYINDLLFSFCAAMTGEQNGEVFRSHFRDLLFTISHIYAVVSLLPDLIWWLWWFLAHFQNNRFLSQFQQQLC